MKLSHVAYHLSSSVVVVAAIYVYIYMYITHSRPPGVVRRNLVRLRWKEKECGEEWGGKRQREREREREMERETKSAPPSGLFLQTDPIPVEFLAHGF